MFSEPIVYVAIFIGLCTLYTYGRVLCDVWADFREWRKSDHDT